MSSCSRPLLALALALSALLPAAEAELHLALSGFVEVDARGLRPLTCRADGGVVVWLADDGRQAAPGDPLARLDTTRIANDLEARRRDIAVAEVQAALDRLRLEQELADLDDQRRALAAELATVRARLAAVGVDDALAVADAAAGAERAEADARRVGAEAARAAASAAAGDTAAEEALAAAASATAAALRRRPAQLALERAQAVERGIERARLALRERELVARIGREPADGEAGSGIAGRLAAVTARRSGQERNAAAELAARRREVHDAERDVCDHTPVAWIELDGPGGERRRIAFAPAGAAAEAGWEPDHGEPFDGRRGHGWDVSVAAQMQAGPDGRGGVCLVAGRRTWRCLLAPGTWTVRVGVGAAQDWEGALVQVAGAEPWCANRVEAGAPAVCVRSVAVGADGLAIAFGDAPGRTLRADAAGLVVRAPATGIGSRLRGRTQAVIQLADPGRLRIGARVEPDVAALLRPPAAPGGGEVARLRAQLAPVRVAVATADGLRCAATVERVSEAPVGRRRGPGGWVDEDAGDLRDQLWREVWLRLEPADAQRTRPGAAATAVLSVPLPADAQALPPHLVSFRDESAAVVLADGRRLPVAAVRAGERVVVRLPPGAARLAAAPPAAEARGEDLGPWPGEVVAGASVRVILPRSWGRVERLVADGARVAVGEELMQLSNPQIEKDRERLAQRKARAREDHRIAQENSRLRLLQAAQDRLQRSDALESARLDLAELLRPDPWPAAGAEAAIALARAQHEQAAGRLARLRGLAAPDPAELAAAEDAAARAELALEQARLALVPAVRGADALALLARGDALRAAIAAARLGEGGDAIARLETANAAEAARLRLEDALQGDRREREFNEVRVVRAPAAGRAYLLNGWDETQRRWGRIAPGATVWGGLPLADIIDPARLAFRAEVPERRYAGIAEGAPAALVFPQLGGLRVAGRVARKARLLDLRRDAREEKLAPLAPVFTVTIEFSAPAGASDDLAPGVKGHLELP